jgi:hypothetical protein
MEVEFDLLRQLEIADFQVPSSRTSKASEQQGVARVDMVYMCRNRV